MFLKVTLREESLEGSNLEVVVRLGVWNNTRIRENYTEQIHASYEELLEREPTLRERLAEKDGEEFAVISVFARPGPEGLLPDHVGAEDLRAWLANHDPASRYGRYREAVVAHLLQAGYEVLPTDTVYLDEGGVVVNEPTADHYDIVVANLTDGVLDELLGYFSEEIDNPERRR